MGVHKFVRMTCDRCGIGKEYAQPAENEPINPIAEWETVEIPYAPHVVIPESHEELERRRMKTICPNCSQDLKTLKQIHNDAIVKWFEKCIK